MSDDLEPVLKEASGEGVPLIPDALPEYTASQASICS